MPSFLKLIDTSVLAGWVRAAVAAGLGALGGYFVGPLAGFADPNVQMAIGVVLSTVVVGIWQQVAKKFA